MTTHNAVVNLGITSLLKANETKEKQMNTKVGIIFTLKFTRNDGQTWEHTNNEFFYSQEIAQTKAKRLNDRLPDLNRYEVHQMPLSWDEPLNY